MSKFAIRLSDLGSLAEFHPLRWLLRPYLTEQTVNVSSSQFDGVGVVVNPDVPGLDWPAALQVALSANMPQGYPIRVYEKGEGGAWVRLRPTPPK